MSDLIPEFYIGDLRVDDYPYSVVRGEGGLDLGAGANVMTVVDALLQDGEREESSKTSNRTLVLPLYVEGADLLELAQAETTLIQACEKAFNTFTLVPGDGIAPSTVFETYRIQARHVRNDDEEAAMVRRWDLTIPAMPWVRSATEQTVAFAPGSGTYTTLDECAATTNWVSVNSTTVSTATYLTASAVKLEPFGSGVYASARWTGTLGGASFITVDAHSTGKYPSQGVVMVLGGGAYNPKAVELLASGFYRLYFDMPTSAPVFQFSDVELGASGTDFYVDKVGKSTAFPSSSLLIAEIAGSVRTPGSVVVAGGASLGRTMVYSDPTMLEYGWSPSDGSTWANAPDGTYVAYLRIAGDDVAAGGLWGVDVTPTVGTSQSVSTRVDFTDLGNSRWFPVGVLDLGGKRTGRLGLAATDFDVKLNGGLYAGPGTASIRLFREHPDAALVHIRAHSYQRLVIDVPSMSMPQGGVWGANSADLSDAVTVEALADSWGFPLLAPPMTALWVASSGVANPAVSLTFYPRGHTFMDC